MAQENSSEMEQVRTGMQRTADSENIDDEDDGSQEPKSQDRQGMLYRLFSFQYDNHRIYDSVTCGLFLGLGG